MNLKFKKGKQINSVNCCIVRALEVDRQGKSNIESKFYTLLLHLIYSSTKIMAKIIEEEPLRGGGGAGPFGQMQRISTFRRLSPQVGKKLSF